MGLGLGLSLWGSTVGKPCFSWDTCCITSSECNSLAFNHDGCVLSCSVVRKLLIIFIDILETGAFRVTIGNRTRSRGRSQQELESRNFFRTLAVREIALCTGR